MRFADGHVEALGPSARTLRGSQKSVALGREAAFCEGDRNSTINLARQGPRCPDLGKSETDDVGEYTPGMIEVSVS